MNDKLITPPFNKAAEGANQLHGDNAPATRASTIYELEHLENLRDYPRPTLSYTPNGATYEDPQKKLEEARQREERIKEIRDRLDQADIYFKQDTKVLSKSGGKEL